MLLIPTMAMAFFAGTSVTTHAQHTVMAGGAALYPNMRTLQKTQKTTLVAAVNLSFI